MLLSMNVGATGITKISVENEPKLALTVLISNKRVKIKKNYQETRFLNQPL